MNGVEMMLKSMGLDPQKITESIKGILETAQAIEGRLTAIETRLSSIEARQGITTAAEVATNNGVIEHAA